MAENPKREEAAAEILRRLSSKTHSADLCQQLERMTVGQTQNAIWFEEREFRLTASNFGAVCKSENWPSLAKALASNLKPRQPTLDMQWGTKMEPVAIKDYMLLKRVDVQSAGLFVKKDLPYLGASPDGLVENDGLVEVKCIPSLGNYTLQQAMEIPTLRQKLPLTPDGGSVDRTHKFYYQLQGQLALSGRCWADLILYGHKGILGVFRERRNESFWHMEMLPKLKSFYNDHLLLELTSLVMGQPIPPQVKKTCNVCHKPSRNSCGNCKDVSYCSTDHQKSDWKNHKSHCARVMNSTNIVCTLPDVALKHIFKFCSAENRVRISKVCQNWRRVAKSSKKLTTISAYTSNGITGFLRLIQYASAFETLDLSQLLLFPNSKRQKVITHLLSGKIEAVKSLHITVDVDDFARHFVRILGKFSSSIERVEANHLDPRAVDVPPSGAEKMLLTAIAYLPRLLELSLKSPNAAPRRAADVYILPREVDARDWPLEALDCRAAGTYFNAANRQLIVKGRATLRKVLLTDTPDEALMLELGKCVNLEEVCVPSFDLLVYLTTSCPKLRTITVGQSRLYELDHDMVPPLPLIERNVNDARVAILTSNLVKMTHLSLENHAIKLIRLLGHLCKDIKVLKLEADGLDEGTCVTDVADGLRLMDSLQHLSVTKCTKRKPVFFLEPNILPALKELNVKDDKGHWRSVVSSLRSSRPHLRIRLDEGSPSHVNTDEYASDDEEFPCGSIYPVDMSRKPFDRALLYEVMPLMRRGRGIAQVE